MQFGLIDLTLNKAGQLKASSEIEEIKWLTYADCDKISHVDKLIFDHLIGLKY